MSASSPEYSPFFAVMGASAAMVFSGKIHVISTLNSVNALLNKNPE